MKNWDVAIVGSGPAGTGLGAELVRRGLTVCVLSPHPERPWEATFGVWTDEADQVGISHCLASVARHTEVRTDAVPGAQGPSTSLGRGYARVDNASLRAHVLTGADALSFVTGEVVGVTHRADGSTLACRGTPDVSARVVIDASGHRPALLKVGPPRSAQTAYGVVLEGARCPAGDDGALLMDFSPVDADDLPGPPAGAATFLYAMPMGHGPTGAPRVLFEETSLVGAPAHPASWLAARLERRLAARGIEGDRVSTETVFIPMGGPLPDLRDRTLGFGAAAGMVHPATGYQLMAALTRAPDLAAGIASGIGAGDTPEEVAAGGWRLLWTPSRRRTRDLLRFGTELLLSLDGDGARLFFDAFFNADVSTAPDAGWRTLMRHDASFEELTDVLTRAFVALPAQLQRNAAALLVARRPSLLPYLFRALSPAGSSPSGSEVWASAAPPFLRPEHLLL